MRIPKTKLTTVARMAARYGDLTWQHQPELVYIGHANGRAAVPTSIWANPYPLTKNTPEARRDAATQYRAYIAAKIASNPAVYDLRKLRGKTLVCYCSADGDRGINDRTLCHGHILMELIDSMLPPVIPAVSLWEPWGWLVLTGHKKHETRDYPPSFGGRSWTGDIVIQVAKSWKPEQRAFIDRMADSLGIKYPYAGPKDHPLMGKAVAVARLDETVRMDSGNATWAELLEDKGLGDFSPGRFIWRLTDIRPLDPPIPMIGYQRLWGVEHPLFHSL